MIRHRRSFLGLPSLGLLPWVLGLFLAALLWLNRDLFLDLMPFK